MSEPGHVPIRRSWLHSIVASLALTFLVGGVVVGTAAAYDVGSQQQ
ncbi:MAG: hypothetical protein JWM12_994 [Ilumatobacteraceae bacterium]|nr:hypothetical protein [Ilumatobacteraceae bacterium]